MIIKNNMRVAVVKLPRMIGYRFDAETVDSIPLAIDLAVRQARGQELPHIEIDRGQNEIY